MPIMGSWHHLVTSWLKSIVTYTVPHYDDKQAYDRTNAWIAVAPLLLLVVQIHLLIRYDPKSTWLLRASLVPIISLLALKSAFGLYYTANGAAQRQGRGQAINASLGCGALVAVIRSLELGLARKRPRLKIAKVDGMEQNGKEKDDEVINRLPVCFPGTRCPLELDLMLNTRGIGWEHGIKEGAPALPVPTYSSQERWKWICKRMAPVPLYFLLLDTVCVLLEEPRFNVHAGNPLGGSIWDCSTATFGQATPYLVCLAFASIVTSLGYSFYVTVASFSVAVLHESPARWDPPLFRVPWLSTSVSEFWNKRWHQMLRSTFMAAGYWPVRAALKRIAGLRVANIAAICGAFLASGIIHELGRSAMVPGFKITGVTVFFAIQPVAIFGEQLFEYATGRRVGGFWGWVWAVSWILTSAPLLLEGYARAGYNAQKNEYIGFTRGAVVSVLDWCDRTFSKL